MDLEWLQSFVHLAQTGSFSRSAEESHVTQPAFSRRIKAVETWLGTPLVDRSTYPTKLTTRGKEFLKIAEEVIGALHAIKRDFADDRLQETNIINIAALHTLSLTFFPKWVGHLGNDIRKLNYRLISDNLHDCVQALVEGSCDLLLCYSHESKPIMLDANRFPNIVLGKEVVIPVSAPRGKRRPMFSLPSRADQPVPLLAYSPESFLGSVLDAIFRERRRSLHFRVVYENSFAEALKAMAVAGFGLTWLPMNSVQPELASGRLVRAGPANWDLAFDIRLFRAADRGRPATEQLWVAAAKAARVEL